MVPFGFKTRVGRYPYSHLAEAYMLHISRDSTLGCARFAEIASELTKAWSSGATEFGV